MYMKLLFDFDKRKDQQIKGMGERSDNTIIRKQTILYQKIKKYQGQ